MINLTDREKQILRSVIQEFIDTAAPVGSSQIAQKIKIDLKAASVRRIMASLEEKGLLMQPHTSAGRIPTSMGYRVYVNELLKKSRLTERQEKIMEEAIREYDGDVQLFMGKVATVLAKISKQIGIIVTPKFYEAVLERIHLLPVASNRVMVILTVKDQQVRTILVEVNHKVDREDLHHLARKINRRFHGKTLQEIKNSFSHVMADMQSEKTGLVRFFAKTADRIFDFSRYENFWLHGTNNIIHQPEFTDVQRFSGLIEVLEDKEYLFHFMEKRERPPGIKITIGSENEIAEMKECSVITSTYRVGDILGVVGVIGPMRMRYHKVIPVVEFMASAITRKLGVA
ncbi:MAG: heat-inducible transcription repressor HrcA [Calditrichaeota bacterium]|nr:heat-inducible transcription repressor HrcA [Calditrichota bacterium]